MWIVRSRLKVYKKKIHIPLDGTKDMMKVNWSNFHCDKVIPLIISELYDTEFITKLTMSFNQFITPFLYRHKFHLRAEKLNSTGKKKGGCISRSITIESNFHRIIAFSRHALCMNTIYCWMINRNWRGKCNTGEIKGRIS